MMIRHAANNMSYCCSLFNNCDTVKQFLLKHNQSIAAFSNASQYLYVGVNHIEQAGIKSAALIFAFAGILLTAGLSRWLTLDKLYIEQQDYKDKISIKEAQFRRQSFNIPNSVATIAVKSFNPSTLALCNVLIVGHFLYAMATAYNALTALTAENQNFDKNWIPFSIFLMSGISAYIIDYLVDEAKQNAYNSQRKLSGLNNSYDILIANPNCDIDAELADLRSQLDSAQSTADVQPN